MPPLDIGAFDPLTLYRYRVELRLARALLVPSHRRAVLWRGAFGSVFRALVCHDLALACEACPLRAACPFPRVFAPSIPAGRPEIARLRDPPRPFVLADPHPLSPSLPAGEPVTLGLTLVGKLTDLVEEDRFSLPGSVKLVLAAVCRPSASAKFSRN